MGTMRHENIETWKTLSTSLHQTKYPNLSWSLIIDRIIVAVILSHFYLMWFCHLEFEMQLKCNHIYKYRWKWLRAALHVINNLMVFLLDFVLISFGFLEDEILDFQSIQCIRVVLISVCVAALHFTITWHLKTNSLMRCQEMFQNFNRHNVPVLVINVTSVMQEKKANRKLTSQRNDVWTKN